jgi:uncharacterized membrane protein
VIVSTRWLWLYLSGLAVAAYLAELAWYYPQLPWRVPLHFSLAGQPGGLGTKPELLACSLSVLAFVVAMLSLTVCLAVYLPARLINLPHHEYWLAPERAKTTRRMLVERTGWISCAVIVLLVGSLHSWLHAPLRQPHAVLSPLISLVVFLAFVAAWGTELLWRFSRQVQ